MIKSAFLQFFCKKSSLKPLFKRLIDLLKSTIQKQRATKNESPFGTIYTLGITATNTTSVVQLEYNTF